MLKILETRIIKDAIETNSQALYQIIYQDLTQNDILNKLKYLFMYMPNDIPDYIIEYIGKKLNNESISALDWTVNNLKGQVKN